MLDVVGLQKNKPETGRRRENMKRFTMQGNWLTHWVEERFSKRLKAHDSRKMYCKVLGFFRLFILILCTLVLPLCMSV